MSLLKAASVRLVVVLTFANVDGFIVTVNDFDVQLVQNCCKINFVLSDNLTRCIESTAGELNQRVSNESDLVNHATKHKYSSCFANTDTSTTNSSDSSIDFTELINCIDIVRNGSLTRAYCSNTTRSEIDECDSIMTPLIIYGATMVIFANIVYLLPYVLVCLLYLLIPGISRRAYDKAVLCFTISQAILSATVIIVGHFLLCHKPLSNTSYSLVGITFMIMTIGGVLWLLVISFDVSSTITRFQWAPASGAKGQDENHKFRIYLTWVSIGSIVPTAISASLEFLPISDDFPLKPNFHILDRLNYRVIAHVASVPALGAIVSNVLFIYTTVKMINIQRSTSVANANRKKSVMDRYILYLKLYLLMDAPYITGALGSIYRDLWILKFCRILQPLFMLYAVLPRDIISNALSCKNTAKSHLKKPRVNGHIQSC